MGEGMYDDGIAGGLLADPLRDDGWQLPPGVAPDDLADAVGPDWPPDSVPIALWPVETLRRALTEAPGAQLARVVAETVDRATELDPDRLAELSDDALGDLVVACGRMQSWMAGVQARVVAERSTRESHALAHNSLVGQVTGELVVTEPEAVDVVVRAESGARHPSVIAALVAGRIDVRRAQVLLRSASQLTVAERTEAIERLLPQAPRRTWKWLQTRMLAFAKARHGAAQTAKTEAQRRCVQLDRAENDMGWLSAYLPAADAAAVWGVVDDMAHQLRHATGEDRTLGQLRADSLTGIITGRLLPADRFTVPGTTTEPSTEPSTELATETRENAADGPSTGYAEGGTSSGSSGGTDGGNTRACTCGGRIPGQEIVRPVRIVPTRPVVRVTIPASALLGLDQAPGHLDGYGPVPAETARIIATDATWQRLLTDPVTGILTDYSTTTYQPGKVLRAAVEARDGTCTFLWGCDLPASRCDLDHIQPFDHKDKNNQGGENRSRNGDDHRGQTNADNLHTLCRKHHLLKTHAGWGIVRDPLTGVTTWTTPTGRTHTRPPTVLDTHIDLDHIDPDTSHDLTLHALTGQRLPRQYATTTPDTTPTSPTVPPDLDEPPF
ncbi:HNH endonuclease [Promicromonospora vindobonensis]|uniref:HNH endonuclease n=1 Tax=Promicromonospora vindobonensis TaxID=195748 RepID=A0ABW5VRJ9_9MICO